MNAATKIEAVTMRTPFPDHQISKLPKATKAQNDAVKADFKKGIRCTICGGWHHPEVVHLDYVGHAALTDRMLDVDPDWDWEPFAVGPDGLPVFDRNGGLWIRLTILGKTRPGYGDADGKTGGNAVKEAIGDALRNAAMRFGAALDLWHKGDLHLDDEAGGHSEDRAVSPQPVIGSAEWGIITDLISQTGTDAKAFCQAFKIASVKDLPTSEFDRARAMLNKKLAAKEPAE